MVTDFFFGFILLVQLIIEHLEVRHLHLCQLFLLVGVIETLRRVLQSVKLNKFIKGKDELHFDCVEKFFVEQGFGGDLDFVLLDKVVDGDVLEIDSLLESVVMEQQLDRPFDGGDFLEE